MHCVSLINTATASPGSAVLHDVARSKRHEMITVTLTWYYKRHLRDTNTLFVFMLY